MLRKAIVLGLLLTLSMWGSLNPETYIRQGVKDPGGYTLVQQAAATGVGNSANVPWKQTPKSANLLTATVTWNSSTGSITGPTGWTGLTARNCTGISQQTLWKVGAASEPILNKITLPGVVNFSIIEREISGVTPINPIDQDSSQCDASSTTLLTPSLTPSLAPEWAISSFSINNANPVSSTPAAGWTEDYDGFIPNALMEGQENNNTVSTSTQGSVVLGTASAGIGELTLLSNPIPKHILTVDYGDTFLTPSFTYPTATIPYLSIEQLGTTTMTDTMRAQGVKTYLYTNGFIAVGVPPDNTFKAAGGVGTTGGQQTTLNFLHNCAGNALVANHGASSLTAPWYYLDWSQPSAVTAYESAQAGELLPSLATVSQHFDWVYIDGGPDVWDATFKLLKDVTTGAAAVPCANGSTTTDITSAQYEANVLSGLSTLPFPVMTDGLNNITGSGLVCQCINGLVAHIFGAREEDSYISNGVPASGNTWIADANTEIDMANLNGPLHIVQSSDYGIQPAGSVGQSHRLFYFASYFLTYNPLKSASWYNGITNNKITPANSNNLNFTGTRLWPEDLIYMLNPVVPEPGTDAINTLRDSVANQAYYREYKNCYYNGVAMGSCAAIANPSATLTVNLPAALVTAFQDGAHANIFVQHNGTGLSSTFCTLNVPAGNTCLGAELASGGYGTIDGGIAPNTLSPNTGVIVFNSVGTL